MMIEGGYQLQAQEIIRKLCNTKVTLIYKLLRIQKTIVVVNPFEMLSDLGMKWWSMDYKAIQKLNFVTKARKTIGNQKVKKTSLQTFAHFSLVPWRVFSPSSGVTSEWGSGDKYTNLLRLLRTVMKGGSPSELKGNPLIINYL